MFENGIFGSSPLRDTILIIQAGGIGDTVMSIPALRAIRAFYPNANIYMFITERASQIVRDTSYVDEIICGQLFRTTDRNILGVFRIFGSLSTLLRLRQLRPGIVIDFNSIESCSAAVKRALVILSLGAQVRAGRNTDGRGSFYSRRASEELFGDRHEVRRILDVAREIGIHTENESLELSTGEQDQRYVRELFRANHVRSDSLRIAINPCSFRPNRAWPVEHFTSLAQELERELGARILVTGTVDESSTVYQVAEGLKDGIEVVGAGLTQLAALYRDCHLLVTNDSGPMHIGAAMNVPIVALFGPENSHRYHPFMDPDRYIVVEKKVDCRPCRLSVCSRLECLKAISVDEVIAACRHLITCGSG